MAKKIPLVRRVSVLTEMKRIRKQVKPEDRSYFDWAMGFAKYGMEVQTEQDDVCRLHRMFALEDPRSLQ